ncbi:MAG: hypothetical protein IIZ36_02070 [Ruminococcus sp.]|nr:hypothetical protein [Ruminococcus sp.]
MKKHRKLITALLTLTLCASCFTLTAHAEPEVSGEAEVSVVEDPQPPAEQSVVTPPDDESSILPGPDPEPAPVQDDESSNVVSDPQSSNSGNIGDNGESYNNNNNNNNYYYNPDYGYSQDDYYSDESSGGSAGYYIDSQGEESYLGGGQNYIPPQNIAPTADLYEIDERKIDDKVLSGNDWKDIQANLSNAKNTGGDSDDFSFIKNNVSKTDNGDWMLIAGVAAVLLSLVGITYVIISSANQRKRASAGASNNSGSNNYYQNNVSDGYDDGYRSNSPRGAKKQNRSKYDTADIPRPKNNGNGRRYR